MAVGLEDVPPSPIRGRTLAEWQGGTDAIQRIDSSDAIGVIGMITRDGERRCRLRLLCSSPAIAVILRAVPTA